MRQAPKEKEDHLETDEEEEGARLRLAVDGAGAGYGGTSLVGEKAFGKDAKGRPAEAEGFLQSLEQAFGFRLLVILFVVQHLTKGFGKNLVDQATPYVYRDFQVPAPQVQIFSGVTELPWAVKPILGLVSDVVPIFGYHKAPYMLLTSVGGVIALYMAGTGSAMNLPHRAILGVVVCLVVYNMQVSFCDLLTEAKYAERISDAPARGPALLSYVWFGIQAGGTCAVLLSGTLIETMGPQAAFLVAAVPSALVVVPVLTGYTEETRVTREQIQETRARYWNQMEACLLCVLMFAGTVAIMICGLVFEEPTINAPVALGVGAVMLLSFSLVLSPTIARFNAFVLLQVSMSVSYSGASFYFFTDSPEMYPEGPHFSKFFYNTVMGTVGAVCSMVGIISYHRYLSKWNYRSVIIFANLVVSVFGVFDVIMFLRLNRRWGIPDEYFVFSLAVMENITQQWAYMPSTLLLASLCPRGMEATMFALLAGCHNLGLTISANSGAMLLELASCRPRGALEESDQFEHLWRVAAVSAALPLVTVLLLHRLVPDAVQGEHVLRPAAGAAPACGRAADERDPLRGDMESATAGSLWRRWRCAGQRDLA